VVLKINAYSLIDSHHFLLSCAGRIGCLAAAGPNLSILFISEREPERLADTPSGKLP
jgi:hypothetical protein